MLGPVTHEEYGAPVHGVEIIRFIAQVQGAVAAFVELLDAAMNVTALELVLLTLAIAADNLLGPQAAGLAAGLCAWGNAAYKPIF